MIRHRNCPFPYNYEPYTPEPYAINLVLNYVPDMEFVFMDLEGHTLDEVEPNVREVIARARAVNPDIRAGNYNYFPGEYDGSRPRESQADRTNDPFGADLNEIYLTSGLDVAMPSCYPYEYYERHTMPGQYGGSSPNKRSALFWAPLERLCVAKRDLPPGHLLMPVTTPFVAWDGYEAPPPPPADVEALTQHLRLRGADAFYSWSSGADDHPDFDSESYRQFALAAWLALDGYFGSAASVEVLNLETHKIAGVEWSGIRNGQQVVILASNLGVEDPATIALPQIEGLPATITVPLGEHVWFEFELADCPAEFPDSRMNLFVSPSPLTRAIISFQLERAAWAEVGVYDLAGKRLTVVASREYEVGEHTLTWNGRDSQGQALPAGTYFIRLSTESSEAARKVILIK